MQRHSVSSSRISSVGWSEDTMEVQFHNGAVYQYYSVTQSEYSAFLNSSSLGSELSRIDKTHRYSRV